MVVDKKKLAWVKNLKTKENPNDNKKTPKVLAKKLIDMTPLKKGQVVLDPFYGEGAFYNQYPMKVKKRWCEIQKDVDFFEWTEKVDWIVSNPPYSKLNKVFEHSVKVAKKGIALLIGIMNLTPKRIKMLEDAGFGITTMHLCQVTGWFGKSLFFIAEKNKPTIFTYDITAYRMPKDEDEKFKNKSKKYQEDYYKKNFQEKLKKFRKEERHKKS